MSGLPLLLNLRYLTSRIAVLWWCVGIVSMVALTVVSLSSTYSTAAELTKYEETSRAAGDTLYIMNGRVAGLDNIGGIVNNEMALIVGFALPLMAITLMSRATRKEEESGRLELLGAGPISRRAPLSAALIATSVSLLVLFLLVLVTLLAADADPGGSAVYSAGLLGLGLIFMSVAAVAAQLFDSAKAVLGYSFALVLASYIVRGAASVSESAFVWASPHGWADKTLAFGDTNPGPLMLFAVVSVALVGLAFYLSEQRDTGGATFMAGAGPSGASAFLKSPLGHALYQQRTALIGWTIGVSALMAVYGSVSKAIVTLLESTPEMAEFFGGDITASLNPVMAVFLKMLAIVTAGYAVAISGVVKNAESSGRLEATLAGPRAKISWLATHLVSMTVCLLVVFAAGAVALAFSAGAALEDSSYTRDVLGAAPAYFPGVLCLLAIAVFVYAVKPAWTGLNWAVFAVVAMVSYMGEALKLSESVMDVLPFNAAGTAPAEDPRYGAIVIMCVAVCAAVGCALVLFRRRDLRTG